MNDALTKEATMKTRKTIANFIYTEKLGHAAV
jgi:hypothetical protein